MTVSPVKGFVTIFQTGLASFAVRLLDKIFVGTPGQDVPEQNATGNVVALIVIISVAILFVFKICLCMVRVSRAEREAQRAEMAAIHARMTSQRLPPPALPVVFVNPGGLPMHHTALSIQ